MEANRAVIEENIWLCAERGWPATFQLDSGETIIRAFITATDQENKAFVVEKPGERDRPPRILYTHQVLKVEPHWS
jgi:hypothetical protein